MNKCNELSKAGFTLVEILIAAALLSLLTTAVAVASMAFLKNAQQTNLRTARDQIVTQLNSTLSNKKAILVSLKKTENLAFYNCVCGAGTCANVQKPFLHFTLYDVSEQIQSPSYFDSSGFPCDPLLAQCRIRVTTSFFAQCPPDFTSPSQTPPLSCNGVPAEFVAISLTVDENPDASHEKSVRLRTITGLTYIQVADLAAGGCP